MALTATWSDIPTTIGTDGFVASTVAQSAKMNQGVLQNLLWLKGRPYALAADFDGTIFSTTSSTYQNTGIGVTLETTGGRVLVVAYGTALNSAVASANHLTVYQDGVNQGHATEGMVKARATASTGIYVPFAIVFLTPTAPAAGSHTWTLYMRSADNASSVSLNQAQMWALEIGA